MDKEEFRIKLEEINNLVDKKDYEGALRVVDSIDWRRVKNVRTLCVVGEIYAVNKRYEDSREIFLLAYHRAPIGKNILTRLIEVSLKMQDVEGAQDFFNEFVEIAPDDSNRYVLEYKILTARGETPEKKIPLLEKYKSKEFTEKWSYELAKLYYQAGDQQKCVDLCNEIILWFSEGTFVTKAMELKQQLGMGVPAVLSDDEKNTAEDQTDTEEEENELAGTEASQDEALSIDSIYVNNERDLAGVESLQEKISKGLRDIFGSKKDAEEDLSLRQAEENMENADADQDKEAAGPEKTKVILSDPVPEEEEEEEEKEEKAEEKKEEPEDTEKSGLKESAEEKAETDTASPADHSEDSSADLSENASETPETPEDKSADQEEADFNLESLILQQAEKQGIEIPDTDTSESPEENPEVKTDEASDQTDTAKAADEAAAENKSGIPELEEEDFLTEEDMIQAEHEFYYGPGSSYEPELSEEEVKEQQEDKAFTEMLKESMEEEESALSQAPEEISVKPEAEEVHSVSPEKPASSLEEVRVPDTEDEIKAEPPIKPEEEKEVKPAVKEPIMIVPRQNNLTEEEIRLFAYFVKVPGMKEQLLDTLIDIQEAAADHTSRTGNIIVMGGKESGKTRLISSLIPAICKELNLTASKVAYVFADDINDKDIHKIFEKLSGGFLVIEDANQLTAGTVAMLDQEMEKQTDGLIVIIEDEKIGMRKLIARHPKFAKKFTSMINIPIFTNDELVNFARVYTVESGYRIDQMGMLALYNKIGENQKEDEPMSIGAVKIILDNAIAKAEGGILRFNRKKRMDKDGFVVLHEKDFS